MTDAVIPNGGELDSVLVSIFGYVDRPHVSDLAYVAKLANDEPPGAHVLNLHFSVITYPLQDDLGQLLQVRVGVAIIQALHDQLTE